MVSDDTGKASDFPVPTQLESTRSRNELGADISSIENSDSDVNNQG